MFKRLFSGSRMTRECYVRFCEKFSSFVGRFTHQFIPERYKSMLTAFVLSTLLGCCAYAMENPHKTPLAGRRLKELTCAVLEAAAQEDSVSHDVFLSPISKTEDEAILDLGLIALYVLDHEQACMVTNEIKPMRNLLNSQINLFAKTRKINRQQREKIVYDTIRDISVMKQCPATTAFLPNLGQDSEVDGNFFVTGTTVMGLVLANTLQINTIAAFACSITACDSSSAALTITGTLGAPSAQVFGAANQNAIQVSSGAVSMPAYSFVGNTAAGLYAPGQNQLALVASGTARLLVDTTGSVTSFSKYMVHAYKSVTQTVTNGTATIIFNTAPVDLNNNFNTTTGIYTAPVSGYYLVATNVTFTSNNPVADGATRSFNLVKNGTVVTGYSTSFSGFTASGIGVTTNGGGPFSLQSTGLIRLNGGDQLRVDYTNLNGPGITDTLRTNDTHFSVHFVATV